MKELILIGCLLLQEPSSRPPSGVINGQLVFADGTPAQSVALTAIPVTIDGKPPAPGTLRNGRTNENGEFRFTNVLVGRYYLGIRISPATGIGATTNFSFYYPGVASMADASIVTVTTDSNPNDNLRFALPQSASGVTVHGQVRFPPNQPPTVTEIRLNAFGATRTTSMRPDGSFDFSHVWQGPYTVTMNAPGIQPAIGSVVNGDVRVELIAPAIVPVTGSVIVPATASRPRFDLRFESPIFQTPVTANADGSFTTRLPVSNYRITAIAIPGPYYLKEMTSGSVDLILKPLTVSADPMKVAISLGISDGVKAAGKIRMPTDGASTFPTKVMFDGAAVDQSAETSLNDDGTFEFPKINPGTYLARVPLTRSLASAPVVVVIPDKGVNDLEIAIPAPKEIFGRIAVDGSGPPPKFSMLLVRGSDVNVSSATSPQTLAATVRSASADTQVLQVNVNALPDGSFKLTLPEGDYRVSIPSGAAGVPAAYVLKSLTYGKADLLKEPLHVSTKESNEIQVGFGTSSLNPWARLSGRVTGLDRLNGPYRVALDGQITATIETIVAPDGAFEFPRVLQRTSYFARLLPANDAASRPNVTVGDKDVDNVEIIVPSEREISGAITVDGNGTPPIFMLGLRGGAGASIVSIMVRPDPAGAFKVKVPIDERRASVSGLPFGYSVKSFTLGDTDLLKQPMNFVSAAEMRIRIAVDPAVPPGNVRGRVTGVDTEKSSVRVVLNGISSYAVFETAVNPSSTFTFSEIPQGSYAISLLSGGSNVRVTPATIVVSSSDLSALELTASGQGSRQERTPTEEAPTGVSILDIGGGGREAANMSAAVGMARTITTAEVTYLSRSGGKYGSMSDLISAGFLDTRLGGVVSGFTFSVITNGKDYVIAAVPVSPDTGMFAYYTTPDGVIRYSTFASLGPKGQGGAPVQ